MKILQICNKVPFPPKDGGSIATWALATGLVNEDAIIHILALNTSKHAAASVELPEDIKENIQLEMIDHDTGIHIPSLVFNLFFSRQPYNLIRFYSARFQSKLKDFLTREHFDIVLIEGIAMCQYISTIRKVSRAKIIYRAHNSEFQIWQRLSMNTSSVLKKHYYKILAKRVDRFESKQFLKSQKYQMYVSLHWEWTMWQ